VSNYRCDGGTLYRHDPFPTDPDFEIAVGICQDCHGAGCEFLQGRDEETEPNPDEGWLETMLVQYDCLRPSEEDGPYPDGGTS
jgi:hypothetical protein